MGCLLTSVLNDSMSMHSLMHEQPHEHSGKSPACKVHVKKHQALALFLVGCGQPHMAVLAVL